MKKPWEKIWESDASIVDEAPAMWRLLAAHEWGGRSTGQDRMCLACGMLAIDGKLHAPDCEWLRIAKAIGYRK